MLGTCLLLSAICLITVTVKKLLVCKQSSNMKCVGMLLCEVKRFIFIVSLSSSKNKMMKTLSEIAFNKTQGLLFRQLLISAYHCLQNKPSDAMLSNKGKGCKNDSNSCFD